jgi:hypothetical protein
MQQNEPQREAEKAKTEIIDEAERKRRERALDQAIENTFPASDPVSAEQPVRTHRSKCDPMLPEMEFERQRWSPRAPVSKEL